MASEELTKIIAYLILAVGFLGMALFIAKRARENRQSMLDDLAPKVAGEDLLEGGAKNPSQFDEPDDEALEEMAELLGEDDDEDLQ
jgi:Tfp pilus assembly protein PilV|tara:strand:- start:1171 stop:1428 length:258 start_codon:yes stop_codon:yes gene_type:complete